MIHNLKTRGVFLVTLVASVFASGLVLSQDEAPTSLSGFESSELFAVKDGEKLDPEDPLLSRLIHRAQSIREASTFERFANYSKDISNQDLVADSQASRFWVFKRTGNVVKIVRMRLPEDIATEEMSEFWFLHCKADSGESFLVVSPTIPVAWTQIKGLNEPMGICGFYFGLKTLAPVVGGENAVPVFVCKNVGWFPSQTNEEIGLDAEHIQLSTHGVDLSNLDLVRNSYGNYLTAEENDVFYQFLTAAKSLASESEQVDAIEPLAFIDLLKDPNGSIGNLVEFEGNVKQVVTVAINEERQQQLGCKEFYQLNMFVSLAGQPPITVTNAKGEKITYKDQFPVTFQVPVLAKSPKSYEGRMVEVKGYFYRLWNYQSEFTRQAGNEGGQLSPLVVGFEPKIVVASSGMLDTLLTSAAIAFVVGLVALMWYLRQSDKKGIGRKSRLDNLPNEIELS